MSQAKVDITAIIYDKRGKVLSIGKNSYIKTHPYQARCAHKVGLPMKQYLHAEISAIIRCRNLDKAHRMIVTRFGKDGKALNAKPCPVCQSAIDSTKIKIIEHT